MLLRLSVAGGQQVHHRVACRSLRTPPQLTDMFDTAAVHHNAFSFVDNDYKQKIGACAWKDDQSMDPCRVHTGQDH
jgi:hypothetical protein